MARACPSGFDVAGLRAQVLATYGRVARDLHVQALNFMARK